jgi:hypothetical protein
MLQGEDRGCWKKTEDAGKRGQSMLQVEDKACFWERTEDVLERGQRMLLGECRDPAERGQSILYWNRTEYSILEQDKAFFWERIEDASKSMLHDGGCAGRGQRMLLGGDRGYCWERKEAAAAYRGQRVWLGEVILLREARVCCWESAEMLLKEDRECYWNRTEHSSGRG